MWGSSILVSPALHEVYYLYYCCVKYFIHCLTRIVICIIQQWKKSTILTNFYKSEIPGLGHCHFLDLGLPKMARIPGFGIIEFQFLVAFYVCLCVHLSVCLSVCVEPV